MKRFLLHVFYFLISLPFSKISAQDFNALYNFSGSNNTVGRVDPTPVPIVAGVTFGSFRAVAPAGNPNNMGANPNATGRFSFTGWPTGATNGSNTFTGTINTGQFYEVTISPEANYSVALDSITFTIQRSGTGIRQYSVRSNRDNFAANLTAVIEPAAANLSVVAANTFQVSDAASGIENGSKIILAGAAAFTGFSTPVTFRFYGWNAESQAGTFSIDNVQMWGSAMQSPVAPNITTSTNAISFPSTSINNSSASSSYTLQGENLNAPVNISTVAPFSVSANNTNFSEAIDIPAADVSAVKTIYVRFNPTTTGSFSSTISHNTTGAATKAIFVSGEGIDPANLVFSFNDCLTGGTPGTGFTSFSVSGPQTWICSNFGRNTTKGVEMNGFLGGPVENEDWLISPPLALGNLTLPILRFYSRNEFSGPFLQLLVSTDYNGSSNPAMATWTELEANFPPANNTWTLSDGIDLSPFRTFPKVYIAFKYSSSEEFGASRWTLDDIDITNRTELISVSPTLLNFGEATVGSNSAGLPLFVKAIGYGDVMLTAPANYTLSFDSVSYTSSITLSQAMANAGTKLFARLSPSSKLLKIDGRMRITAPGLDSNTTTFSGTSYPRSETFDAGSYNLSFFGSNPTNNPTPQKITLQVNNVAVVFNRLKLDITGINEVSNDVAMDSLVSKIPNSRAILSHRWSYSFDAPDPNFPPQKIGFLFDTTTMKLVEARAMFEGLYDSARNGHPGLLPNYPGGSPSSFWASGRLPYMAVFDANINGVIKRIRIIVIHGKSATDATSYNRRVYDARVLKDTLDAFYTNENVLLVGDYNDRLIGSIYSGSSNSPYKPFIDDGANYSGLTLALDQDGRSSFIGGSNLIDHIVISQTLLPAYIDNSTEIEDPRTYISGYNGTTASDHLPVYSRFNFVTSLPVTFTHFTATPTKNSVVLNWATAQEFNNDFFELERSYDQQIYTVIDRVKGIGNSVSVSSYRSTDQAPLPGVSYYRIKQTDIDGKSTFSKVERVQFNNQLTHKLTISPNPVTNYFNAKVLGMSGNLNASIIDISGKTLLVITGNMNRINQQINLHLNSFKKGMYLLRVEDAEKHFLTPFIRP